MPLHAYAPKTRSENLRSAYCTCARIGMERGLRPLNTERTLDERPALAPHCEAQNLWPAGVGMLHQRVEGERMKCKKEQNEQ
ncbi:hypothetical protein NDU88_005751 [Pleurodeles waltl]|uniref:Uncharacterized protein n=1 Tax=Pleurodeles waltl TaxID=8319 RepID=A0AAV7LM04_PLEWA|nr:hypothetical protein NDU88_005751 [Pleurodeles waltl]